jgi:hypothetical protein
MAVAAIAMPLSAFGTVPWLNSDAGAPHTIYLDFDGHYEPASTNYCPPPFNATPEGWPIDFETSDISGSLDSQTVREIWEAVAEDFASFNVNVTTDPREEPHPDTAHAIRVAIGIPLRGGVALGSAPSSCDDPLTNPPYLNPRIAHVTMVHFDPGSTVSTKKIAKRISHEAGHLYGLLHHTAPRGLIDDWIMAPERASTRYVWRVGPNEFGQPQDDLTQLAWLLGRRADEPNPRQLLQIGGGPPLQGGLAWPGLYTYGTLATVGDTDDYLFTVPWVDSLTFQVVAGAWTNPRAPTYGSEPNVRYRIQIRSQSGDVRLACPTTLPFTLSTTTLQNILSHPDCVQYPTPLRIGETYRVRVFRDPSDNLPGNLGRYTVHVSRPSLPLPLPPLLPKSPYD